MDNPAFYHDARVLVTGASGFIGRRLCAELLSAGAEVIALANEGTAPNIDDAHWCTVDISDYDNVVRCMDKHRPNVVFNMAALVTGDRSIELVNKFIDVNLVGAVNVMRAAVVTGRPRVVLCGSMEEASEQSGDETPYSAYAASKHAARLFGKLFQVQYDLDVIMTRLFMVYGPGQRDLSKLIPYTIDSILNGQAPTYGSGERSVDWIYIDDVVAGLLQLGSRAEAAGIVFDIGSGQSATVRQIVEKVFEEINSQLIPHFGARAERGSETENLANWKPLEDLTGWYPRTSLENGIQKTVEWYVSKLASGDRAARLT